MQRPSPSLPSVFLISVTPLAGALDLLRSLRTFRGFREETRPAGFGLSVGWSASGVQSGLERNGAPACSVLTSHREGSAECNLERRKRAMHGIVYLVGLIVIVMALLSLLGVR